MASHIVNITVLNTPLGIPASDDGVMGIVVQATAVSTTFVLGTSYLLTEVADLTTLGITAANNPEVYQHVTEFYLQAGDGAKLWVTGLATTTDYSTYVASTTFKSMIRGTAIADPLNQIKVIGLCYKAPTAEQHATDFLADVTTAIPLFKTALAALFDEGYHICGVIDGCQMSSTVTPSTIGTLNTGTNYNVGVCITGTKGNGISSIGLLLGKIARITVGTSIGKVADGAVVADTMYLTNGLNVAASTGTLIVGQTYTVAGGTITYNGASYVVGSSFVAVTDHTTFTTSAGGYVIWNSTAIQSLTPTYIESLGSKQYIFARTWFGKAGFFWNDGATACSSELALSTLEFNRIANKLSSDALAFFTDEIGSNLPVETSTGNLDKGYCTNKQRQFMTTYVNPLILSNDISGATMTITGVNFSSTRLLTFVLYIVASPALGNVSGTIEFVTQL
jgi:hypothetical protein